MNSQRLSGLFFVAVFVAYGYTAQDIQLDFWAAEEAFNARSFPYLIALGGSLLSLLLVFNPPASLPEIGIRNMNWPGFLGLLGLMIGYGILLEPTGFIVSTTLFLIIGYLILGERRLLPILLASFPVVISFYFLMDFLGIYLSPGTILLEIIES